MKAIYPTIGLVLLAWVSSVALAKGKAGELLEENRLKEALDFCEQADALSGDNKDNLWDCTWVYFYVNRIDLAEKLMDRLRPEFQDPQYKLLQALSLIKKKSYEKAIELVESVANDKKATAFEVKAWELKGMAYEENKNMGAAAFLYKTLVGDHPNSARAHWGLGRFYLERRDFVRAKNHFAETARLWPKYLPVRFALAKLALDQDDLKEADRWLLECYTLNKSDPGVLEQMGIYFEKKGKLDDAVKFWQRALSVKKDSAIAKSKLSIYITRLIDQLIEAKKLDEALALIDTSGALKDLPDMRLRRGQIRVRLGQYDLALKDLLKYVTTNKKNADAFRDLGVCHLNLKLEAKAQEFFLKSLELDPSNGMTYAWVAFVLEKNGELEKAREAWQKAVDLIKEPEELAKATRKLATIHEKIEKAKAKRKKEAKEKMEEEE